MADKSGIQWTDATWNPTTGCDRVSPGCANCYALTMAGRLKAMGQAAYQRDGDPRTSGPGFGLTLHEDRLEQPLRWTRPRRVFVDSMSDLFHEAVPEGFIHRVWLVMTVAQRHTFQVLTKRPERARDILRWDHLGPTGPDWAPPNVWVGTSVENARWRTRIDALRETNAAVRFISAEPLLGPLTPDLDLSGIDWIIIGGESGPGARPMRFEWAMGIIEAARDQGVAVFVKQLGTRLAADMGAHGKGGDPAEWPPDLRVREWPR